MLDIHVTGTDHFDTAGQSTLRNLVQIVAGALDDPWLLKEHGHTFVASDMRIYVDPLCESISKRTPRLEVLVTIDGSFSNEELEAMGRTIAIRVNGPGLWVNYSNLFHAAEIGRIPVRVTAREHSVVTSLSPASLRR
jgi:hypothetical protein